MVKAEELYAHQREIDARVAVIHARIPVLFRENPEEAYTCRTAGVAIGVDPNDGLYMGAVAVAIERLAERGEIIRFTVSDSASVFFVWNRKWVEPPPKRTWRERLLGQRKETGG